MFANLLAYRIVFFCTLNKKEIRTDSCRADDNGAHIRKGTAKKIFKVAFDETKIKVNSARIFKVDAGGSLYVNKREGATYKKINIESDDVFELFWEYRKIKGNPNFNHVAAYVKKFSTSIISDFYATSKNDDFLIPRHTNVKNINSRSIL